MAKTSETSRPLSGRKGPQNAPPLASGAIDSDIVERKVLTQALFQLKDPFVLVKVDVLVLDGTPEPFHKDVV